MAALDTPQRKAQSDGLALAPRVLAMRIDFAHASEEHLVVYGWVIGLSESVASAMLSVGDILVDLLTDAVRVKRVDVTQNFRDQVRESDEHGFLALIEARQLRAVQTLRLMVSLKTGASAENEWPIIRDEAIGAATLRAHEGALRPLIPLLTLRQKQVLASLGSRPPLSLRADDLRRSESDAVVSLPLHIQLCCLLPGGVLIVGGVLPRPQNEIRALALLCEAERVDLLEGFVKVNDPSATPEAARGAGASAYLPCAFLSAIKLPAAAAGLKDARIEFSSVLGNATARPAVRAEPDEARARFNAHLASVDPGTRLELSERITTLLAQEAEFLQLPELAGSHLAAAVSELQGHLDEHGPEHDLRFYLDRTIRVADLGVFVIGWAQAGPKAKLAITCHGQGAEFSVDERWIRWPRPDVEKHLATLGVAVAEDPGFICFIPIRAGGVPHYLKIRDGSGKVWRIRLPLPASETPMQAIRAVLSTVDVSRADLRLLLDDHVGPAVSALWAAHTPTRQRAVVERFGPQPEAPEVSIVVPLYGRHDFVDIQLALFADDPDFEQAELIYVVDDPAIFQEFRRACLDLHAFYGVSFTLAFPGDNLGFAGATNFGARFARAPHLLLLNSDVMPQRSGWLRSLLNLYEARPEIGVLGAKLLYEDGSIQHAGMTSLRNREWQDLWINDHPHKGMSPVGLSGVLEVECVTAACALVQTALYRALGGLSEDYIIGDFEDSDFCHNVRSHGKKNFVALDVTLYHLERQSQAFAGETHWRKAVTIYNCWLHDRRWGNVIGRMAA